jgi:hypothetical protein
MPASFLTAKVLDVFSNIDRLFAHAKVVVVVAAAVVVIDAIPIIIKHPGVGNTMVALGHQIYRGKGIPSHFNVFR